MVLIMLTLAPTTRFESLEVDTMQPLFLLSARIRFLGTDNYIAAKNNGEPTQSF